MSRKKILILNIFLIALLILLISFNKDHLRPMFSQYPLGRIITGCLPDFIAAFFISLAMLNGILYKVPEYRRLLLYLIPAIIFAILTFEEFIPVFGASTIFDIYDIIAGGIGAIIAIPVYKSAFKKQN